jgi:two-component system phosphate regulon response regulator PhoB
MPGERTILIVDDDLEIADVLREQLERDGYHCVLASDGENALATIRGQNPDLVLLDRMLPGITGDEVVRRMKSDPRSESIPVIMLTGKGDESDELVGLALGADDYVRKPFSPKRLKARIAAHMRRVESETARELGPPPRSLMLDRTAPQVIVDDQAVQLTLEEHRLLGALIAGNGIVLSETQLLRMVFGSGPPPAGVTIPGRIDALRRKMGPAAMFIQSVSDSSYAFCGPACSRHPA